MKNKSRTIVGIDLGTTNSAVAYIDKGKPVLIPSPQGERIIPSVVMLDTQDRILVGDKAKASQVTMPDRVVAAVKRKMGKNEPVLMAGKSFSPPEISAMILKELKSYVDGVFGEGQTEAVITVPAYFTDEQRRATKQAGELAGFVVDRIVNEPTAAALAFGLDQLEEEKYILVYDLGGGTFDVSVVELMSGILEVKASAGNSQLGGEDFDWLLVDWLAAKIRKGNGIDPLTDIRAKSMLKEQAEKIKIELSSVEKTTVDLPFVIMKNDRPVGLTAEITRQDFIGLIEGMLSETIECVQKALADAKVEAAEIQEILLVGGSTRIPRVRELLTDFFGKEPRSDVNPDEAVALGAAVQAGLKSGELADSGLIITDVAPFSLGTSVLGTRHGITRSDLFEIIIPRNTTIPVTRTQRFYTAMAGQTSVKVDIYQGEHELVKYNHSLGKFLLEGIPANYKAAEPVDITYRYDLNGILEVTAKSVSSGQEKCLTVHDALARESEQQFAQSVDKLRSLYENVPEESDEDDEFDDFDIEDVDVEAEQASLEELRGEVDVLKRRLVAIARKSNELKRRKLGKLVLKLEEAITLEVEAEIQEIIDEVTDQLIDYEMEDEE